MAAEDRQTQTHALEDDNDNQADKGQTKAAENGGVETWDRVAA